MVKEQEQDGKVWEPCKKHHDGNGRWFCHEEFKNKFMADKTTEMSQDWLLYDSQSAQSWAKYQVDNVENVLFYISLSV